MPKITVNAYNELHPQHEAMMEIECNKGLDISLLPTFEVEVDAPTQSSIWIRTSE